MTQAIRVGGRASGAPNGSCASPLSRRAPATPATACTIFARPPKTRLCSSCHARLYARDGRRLWRAMEPSRKRSRAASPPPPAPAPKGEASASMATAAA